MEIVQVAALAMVSVCLILAIKNQRPEIAILLSIAAGTALLTICIPKIKDLLDGVDQISKMGAVNSETIGLLLKVVGIVYVTEFAARVCKDAQEESIALKVQIAGKVVILGIALPLMLDILNMIAGILE